MLPVFAKDVLHVDSRGLGILAAAAGMGSLTGFISYAWLQARLSPRNVIVGALTLYNLALIGFAFSDWYWLSFCAILVAGLGHGYFVSGVQVPANTLVTDSAGAMRVYTPPKLGAVGKSNEVTSAEVPDQVSWLRSRRT